MLRLPIAKRRGELGLGSVNCCRIGFILAEDDWNSLAVSYSLPIGHISAVVQDLAELALALACQVGPIPRNSLGWYHWNVQVPWNTSVVSEATDEPSDSPSTAQGRLGFTTGNFRSWLIHKISETAPIEAPFAHLLKCQLFLRYTVRSLLPSLGYTSI